ncbi:MAG: hypothetical protein KHZ87_07265 [Clostridiales bacterium]|nr:hypothetical protein [Clostridiales bacterium]MBS5877304.1 hypothetical protein [Clostridiales bacterium]MDU0939146.1 hypothetical protein [Clostridiales bacterium]MDU1042209.1 hypothetical protein [Clostridiales bacterium]
MKKKVLGILAASLIAVTAAGCGAKGGDTGKTTAATSSTTTTTTAAATKTTTAVETTTVETTPISQIYDVKVKKPASGFSEIGNYSYKSKDGASYTYTMMDDVSPHAMEASLDSLSAQLKDAMPDVKDDAHYVKGKKDDLNFIRVCKSVGVGKELNCYICLEYMNPSDINPDDVLKLISNEYLEIQKK